MAAREVLRHAVAQRREHHRRRDRDAEGAPELTAEVEQPRGHAHPWQVDRVLGRQHRGDEHDAEPGTDEQQRRDRGRAARSRAELRVRSAVPTTTDAKPNMHMRRKPTRRSTRAPRADATIIASIIGVSARPASVADLPCTTWTKSGRNEITPNMVRVLRPPMTVAARSAEMRNRSSGIIGSAVRCSMVRNAANNSALAAECTEDGGRAPCVVAAAGLEGEHEEARPSEQGDRAQPVHPVLVPELERFDHHHLDEHERGDADREVHVEHPAPRELLGEEATDERADDRRDREHAGHHRGDPWSLLERVEVGDDRLRDGEQTAGADALHGAEQHQLQHRAGEAAEARSRGGRSPCPRGRCACARTCRRGGPRCGMVAISASR